MTDDERFFDGSEQLTAPKSWAEWESLALPTRVADRLAAMLLAASDVRTDLQREEAAHLLWLTPEIDRLLEQIDQLLQCLAS